jgi:hypothetical protein
MREKGWMQHAKRPFKIKRKEIKKLLKLEKVIKEAAEPEGCFVWKGKCDSK